MFTNTVCTNWISIYYTTWGSLSFNACNNKCNNDPSCEVFNHSGNNGASLCWIYGTGCIIGTSTSYNLYTPGPVSGSCIPSTNNF